MPRYDTSTLDERVVEMRIDNDNFEKGAKETISTLQKLEKALKLKGDSSAIDDMSKAVNRFDATPIAERFSTAVDSISSKAAFASRIIQNLADDVYNFGKKTIKSLTVDQISAGWDKYTTLAESTQTIMAATKDYYADMGYDEIQQMEAINAYLDKMLWYTDETSYNFNDMVATAGKFLAAGVDIDDAFTAMMGIASWGASAGAKPTDVSHAMQYSIAQAMGTGSMKVQDWKTLENLNMATKEFKENVLEVAADMGKLSRVAKDGDDSTNDFYSTIVDPSRYDAAGYIQKLTEKEEDAMFNWKNMRESLKDGWLDTEVMTEVFKRYGEFSEKLYETTQQVEELGGKELTASNALELLDYYREHGADWKDWEKYAKGLNVTKDELLGLIQALDNTQWKFSETGFRMGQEYKTWQDVVDATKDAVSSGWMQTFKYIIGDFLEAKELWSEVGDLFYKTFAEWGNTRNSLLKAWHDSGGREALLGVEKDAEGFRGALWNIVEAIKGLVHPITQAFSEAFGFDDAESAGQKLATLTQRFREWTTELGFSEEAMKGLKSVFDLVFSAWNAVGKIAGATIGILGKLYTSIVQPLLDFLLRTLGYIFKPLNKVFDFIKGIFGELNLYDTVIKIIDSLGKGLEAIIGPSNSVEQCFKNIKAAVVDAYNFIKEKFAKLGIDLNPIVGSMQSAFAPVKDKIFGFLSPITDRITEFKWRMEQLKDNEELSTLEKVFMSLKATGHSALYLINQELQKLAEKHPALKEFLDMFEGATLKDILTSVKDGIVSFGQSVITWFGPAKDKISEFIETAKPAFEKLGTAFSTLWTKLKEGTTFKDVTDIITGAFKDFGADVADWFEPIKAALEEKIDGFIAWLETIKPKLSEAWQGIIDFIISLFSGKGAGAESITRSNPLLTQADGPFSWLPETIQDALSGILKPIENVLTNFQNALAMLPPIDWDGIFDKVMRFAKLAMTFKGLQAFSSVFKGISSLGKGFKEFGKSIKDFAQNKTVSKNLEAITKGIADFFGNGKNSINSLFDAIKDTLKNGFTIKHKNYDSIGTTILKIAGSIAILVGAIYVLTKLEPDKIKESLIVLVEIAGGLVGLAIAFTILNAFGFDATPMLKMAISLGILIGALYVITKFPIEDFYKGIVRIGLLLAELAAFSKFSGSKFEFSAPFIKLAVALWILMGPLKTLARMDFGSMVKGLIGLGIVMAEFGAFVKSTNGNINTGGFIKMAAAIWILSKTMQSIAKMDISAIAKGLIGIGILMAEFGALIRSTMGNGKTNGVISQAISIGILVAALWAISKMDLWSILKGVVTLGVIMKAFGTMIKDIKGLSFGSGIMSLIVIAGLLAGVYFAFKYLNEQNTDFTNVLKFTTAVAEVAISCGYMIKSLAPIPFVAGLKVIGLFAVFLIAVGALAMGLGGLRQLFQNLGMGDMLATIQDGAEIMEAVAKALGGMIGAFINGIWNETTGGFNLAKLGTDLSRFMENIQGFVDGCKNLKGADFSGIGKLTGAILEIAAGEFISAVVNLFGNGKSTISIFQENVAGLASCLNAFASNMGGITDCSGDIDYAVTAAKGLVELVNSLPYDNGIWQKIAGYKDLGAFSIRITKLGENLKAYAQSIAGITVYEEDIESAKRAAQGLSELNNSLPDEGGILQHWMGSKELGAFGIRIGTLGKGLKQYAESISGISGLANEDDTKTAKKMAQGLTDLQNSLPESGGWVSKIFGDQDLSAFGNQLEALGSGLKSYAFGIFGISSAASDDDIKRAKSIGKGLADLQEDLPRVQGVIQAIAGEKDLANFGKSIDSLGWSLKTYAFSISGISGASEDDLSRAIEIATNLSDVQDSLTRTGSSVVKWFAGERNLNTFATNIGLLGGALKTYADSIQGIEDAPTEEALAVIGSIGQFMEEMKRTGSIFESIGNLFAGDKESTLLTTLNAMSTIGTKFQEFSDGISGAETALANLEAVKNAITSFQSIQNGSESVGNSLFSEADLENIASMASQIPQKLADGIQSNIDTYIESLKSIGETTSEVLNSVLSQFAAQDSSVAGEVIGADIDTGIAQGIQNNSAVVDGSVSEVTAGATNATAGAEQDFYTIGGNLDIGLANGIYANASLPVQATAEMCQAIVDTANSALEVHSPSKAFADIGKYLPAGLAEGVKSNVNTAVQSVISLGDRLIESIQNSMRQVADVANQNFDFQPQITPVVDMSNVRNGATEFNNLFGSRSSILDFSAGISRSMSNVRSAANTVNINPQPSSNTNGDNIVVNVYAAEGQSEESIADSVINRISAKTSRRSVAFG